MLRVDTVGFEEWWQMSGEERDTVVEEFLAKKNPAWGAGFKAVHI